MRRLLTIPERPNAPAAEPWAELPPSVRRFVLGVSGAAALVLLLSLLRLNWVDLSPWSVLFFIVISLLTATFTLQQVGLRLSVSLEDAWYVAAALIFDPAQAVIIAGLSKGCSEGLWRRPGWYRVLFNTANSMLSAGAASLAFYALTPLLQGIGSLLIAGLAAGVLYYGVNVAMVCTVVGLASQRSPTEVWGRVFRDVVIYQVAAVSLAGLIAISWREDPLAVVAITLPLIVIALGIRQVAQLKRQERTALMPDVSAERAAEIAENPLRLLSLDGGRIIYRGEPLRSNRLRSAPARELLFYLAERGQGATVEQACADLWPDRTVEESRGSFHTTVYRLRQAINHDVVIHGAGTYQLNPLGLWYDAAEFRRLLDEAATVRSSRARADILEDALPLYRTDYLPEVYSDWAGEVRLFLLESWLAAAGQLTELYWQLGELEGAERTARRALERDPYAERLFRILIRIALAKDDQAAAWRWYGRCEQALQEMGVEPSVETRALLHAPGSS